MKHKPFKDHRPITARPAFRLVDLLEESVGYVLCWRLPFHSLTLHLHDNDDDPSWIESGGRRTLLSSGVLFFKAAGTPVRVRYTHANRHLSIHFRYELMPGVDVLSGTRGCFRVDDRDGAISAKVKSVFDDPDPVRRHAAAESAALDAILQSWPVGSFPDLMHVAPYAEALRDVADSVTARTGVPGLAGSLGVQTGHFARWFNARLGMRPRDWLGRAIFDRAVSMLADDRRTIRDIALTLEFSDEFHFSRFFKRFSGISPSQFRLRFRQ